MSIRGILPALATAFRPEGGLDLKAQGRLVHQLLSCGVGGFFVCGTMGEFPLLTLEERESLLELVASRARGAVPVVAHVGAPRLEDSLRLALHARKHGADAISAVTPYFFRHSQEAVLEYYRVLAGATDVPFYAYHVPALTHFRLEESFITQGLAIPNLRGLKYSDGDLDLLERLLQASAGRMRILSGHDEALLAAASLGVCGAIGSTFSLMARTFVALWQAAQNGDLTEARRLQGRADRVLKVLHRYPHPAATKEALRLLGHDCGPPRRPLDRLTAHQAATLERDLNAAGLSDG